MLKSSNNGIFSAPAAPSAGTTVAQSGSANTYSASYVQINFPGTSNNTNEADYIVAVRYSTSNINTPTYLSVEIGTGAAGSETVVGIANCPTPALTISGGPPSVGVQIISGRVDLPFPIPVATGTRVAVKTASDVASAISWKIWLECYKQADLIDGGVNESSNVVQINGQTATASGGVTFPSSISSPTNITSATGITVSTNSDKTGYSLTQTFPSNFSATVISAAGAVDSNVQKIVGQPAQAFLSNSSRSALGR